MKTPPVLNLEIPFNECQVRFQFMKFKSNLWEKTQDESFLESFKESKSRKKYDQKYDDRWTFINKILKEMRFLGF